jgi:DNA replication and repair protein RecF
METGDEREQTVGMRRGFRAVRIDGKRPPSLAAYALRTPVVIFHPGSLALSTGGGVERRRLLDRIALYASPASLEHGVSYGRAMRARQRALEKRGDDARDLDGWEELMVRHGVALSESRAEAAQRLVPAAFRAFVRISASGAPLQASYQRGAPQDPAAFRAGLVSYRNRDAARGSATIGPHRDDLVLSLDSKDVRAMASQGQHRAIVLALELGEITVITEARGVRPLLLLDDVSSELDRERTAAFLEALREERGQVLLTTTRPELIESSGLSKVEARLSFSVVNGSIVAMG